MNSAKLIGINSLDPFAVLRRAKNIMNASEADRDSLLGAAERLETYSAWLVLGAIILEAAVWASPLSPFQFKLGNLIADASIAIGIYGEMRFGHIVGNILKIRLGEANERAGMAHERAAKAELALAEYKASRDITEKQMLQLIDLLDRFPGQTYDLSWYSHQECEYLGVMLDETFRGAGWKPRRDEGKSTFLEARQGILVQTHRQAPEATKDAANTLVYALNALQLRASARALPTGTTASDIIFIKVGTKH